MMGLMGLWREWRDFAPGQDRGAQIGRERDFV